MWCNVCLTDVPEAGSRLRSVISFLYTAVSLGRTPGWTRSSSVMLHAWKKEGFPLQLRLDVPSSAASGLRRRSGEIHVKVWLETRRRRRGLLFHTSKVMPWRNCLCCRKDKSFKEVLCVCVRRFSARLLQEVWGQVSPARFWFVSETLLTAFQIYC